MEARWRALAVLTAARTSMGFQFQSIASVSAELVPALSLTYADLGFLIGLYFLPGLLFALPAGAFGQRVGDKRAVLLGLALMVLGGAITALAASVPVLAAGRLISGVGAVILNVLMSKMVTDWFAGREIVLAMSIFVNSFPIGVGLALGSLGWLAAGYGWASGLGVSSAAAIAALLLVGAAYTTHPNDGISAAQGHTFGLSRREFGLVCVAGSIWGIFNGAFSVMFGFAPTLLRSAGLGASETGLLVASATWLVAASVQVGGLLAQRWQRPALLMAVSVLAWSAAMLAMAVELGPPGVMLLAAGTFMGLPVGVIMSLPSQALSTDNRAVGMGMFYLWLYVGHGGIPPVAGWIQDRVGHPSSAMIFIALLVLSILVLYAVFRRQVSAALAVETGG